MRRSIFCSTSALLLLALAAGTVQAQTQEQFDWCDGKNNPSPDLSIGGCTAIIQSGKFTGNQLGLTFRLRAKAYSRKGDSDKALADYDQALKLYPTDVNALTGRAMIFHHKKQEDRALRDLDAAVRIDPNDATSWAYRGDVLYHSGKEAEAIASFERSIKLAPNWMWPANDRGELYADRGDYQLALKDFDHVVNVSPTYAMGWNNRCRVNAILGKLEQALTDCDEALKITPKFTNSMVKSGVVSARQHRGFVHLKAGRYDQAIEDYTLALDIKSNAETLYGRGVAKLKKGDKAGGDADIAAAKALDGGIAEKFTRFGVRL